MDKKLKSPLSTSVTVETRAFIERYAQTHNTTLSSALEEIVLDRARDTTIQPVKAPSEPSNLSEIKATLESIETYLKYLSTKISTLPCNYTNKTY